MAIMKETFQGIVELLERLSIAKLVSSAWLHLAARALLM